MFEGLMNTLSKISFKLAQLAKKYGLAFPIFVADDVYTVITNGLDAARKATPDLSELSQLFRTVVVTSQKTIQVLIDNAIVLLKEISQYKLPGMNEATLADICKNIQLIVTGMVVELGKTLEVYFSTIMDDFNTVQLTFPNGKVMTVAEAQQNVRRILRSHQMMITDTIMQIESPDVVLKKLGQKLQEVVEKGQEFVDKMKCSFLEDFAAAINAFYQKLMEIIEDISAAFYFGYSIPASKIFSKISQNIEEVLNANNGIHQFELPLPFFQ